CFQHLTAIAAQRKLQGVGVDCHLTAWTIHYLTNRPQYVRLHNCVSDVVVCSMGAPQGTVLSPFLFTLFTSDFTHNTDHCHIQKFSDDTAIIGRVSDGNELEYREVIKDFVDWCGINHLHINTSKTKEMVIDFRKKSPPITPVNIQGLDMETVESYKYLGVHLNNKLDCTSGSIKGFHQASANINGRMAAIPAGGSLVATTDYYRRRIGSTSSSSSCGSSEYTGEVIPHHPGLPKQDSGHWWSSFFFGKQPGMTTLTEEAQQKAGVPGVKNGQITCVAREMVMQQQVSESSDAGSPPPPDHAISLRPIPHHGGT
ncbi:hypothetical protein LDENG_00215730, partial [Lucifuga dentata]